MARDKASDLLDRLQEPGFRARRVFELTRNPLLLATCASYIGTEGSSRIVGRTCMANASMCCSNAGGPPSSWRRP